MNSISLHRWARWALFAAICLVMLLALAFAAGLRVNPTPSLPKGIYRISPGTPGKGDLVTFCLDGGYAALARERGYLETGSCPSGLRPLLKRLVGLPGDHIEADSLAVRALDSQGRPMPSVPLPGVIPPGLALVLVFIGTKMLLIDIYPIPVPFSLGVVAVIITTSIVLSLRRDARQRATEPVRQN